jgi:hypothetical protein
VSGILLVHGGWYGPWRWDAFASGSLAALLGGAAEITLRRPLPLDRSLPVGRWTADECHGTSYATGASSPEGT